MSDNRARLRAQASVRDALNPSVISVEQSLWVTHVLRCLGIEVVSISSMMRTRGSGDYYAGVFRRGAEAIDSVVIKGRGDRVTVNGAEYRATVSRRGKLTLTPVTDDGGAR